MKLMTEKLMYLALKIALIILFVLPAAASPLQLTRIVHAAPTVMKAVKPVPATVKQR